MAIILKIYLIYFLIFFSCSSYAQVDLKNNCNPLKHSNGEWALELYSFIFDRWTAEGRTADKVFFGDSIVELWSLNQDNYGGYHWMTDVTPKANVVNTGIYGDNVCTLLLRIKRHVTNFKPKYIFMDGGGNDLVQMIDIHSIQESIILYTREMRNQNPYAKIVYGAIPPSKIPYGNKYKWRINNTVNLMMKWIGNACYVDLYDVISQDGTDDSPIKERYSYDLMHFKPEVYLIYKERVEQAFMGKIGPGVWCY